MHRNGNYGYVHKDDILIIRLTLHEEIFRIYTNINYFPEMRVKSIAHRE